jgi:hypothetical protein
MTTAKKGSRASKTSYPALGINSSRSDGGIEAQLPAYLLFV